MVVISSGYMEIKNMVKPEDKKTTKSDGYQLDFFALCAINNDTTNTGDDITLTEMDTLPSDVIAALYRSIMDKFHPVLHVTIKGERFLILRMGNKCLLGKSENKRFAARLYKDKIAVGIGKLVGDGSCMEQLINKIAKLNV